jgi:hypothetical protein
MNIIGAIVAIITILLTILWDTLSAAPGYILGGGDDAIQTKILKKYPSLKIKKPLPTFDEFCYPKGYFVQKQQKFAGEYMAPSSGHHELLIFHKIGAGKTCASIQVGEKWKKKGRPIVIMPASLIPGFRNELRTKCAGDEYLTDPERAELKTMTPGSPAYKTLLAASDARIDAQWQVFSYNKFATAMKDKTPIIAPIIIVDEVQNIAGQGLFYRSILQWIEGNPTASVVIMSGTPLFDSPREIYSLAHLLRAKGRQDATTGAEQITPKDIKTLFAGKVSYYAGAPDYTFPEAFIKVKKCYMSKYQAKWYKSQVAAEMSKHGTILLKEVSNDFYIKSRQQSNITYPNGLSGQAGLDALTKSKILSSLDTYSCKYAALVRKLRKNSLSFVYTGFTGFGGIAALIKCLRAFGYKDFGKDGPGKRRFAIWSGDQTGNEKDTIRATFNAPSNDDCSQIQVVIGSPSIKEGVTLLRVRQVHILEAYWNHGRLEQIYGRAVRFCSHKSLPEEDRNVTIYIYAGLVAKVKKRGKMSPLDSIDLYMLQMADQKKYEIAPYVLALQEVAVDRLLYYK